MRGWNFRGAEQVQRLLGKYLDNWDQQLRAQLRRDNGNLVPAVLEVLAIGSRMTGRIERSDPSEDDIIAGLFGSLPAQDSSHRSVAWQQLMKTFVDYRRVLIELLLNNTACTKGGSTKIRVIDAAQYLAPLRKVRENWQITTDVPALPWAVPLAKVHEAFLKLLSVAIAEERKRIDAWCKRVQERLGSDPKAVDVGIEVMDCINLARQFGMFGGKYDDLKLAVAEFQAVDVTSLVTQAGDGARHNRGDALRRMASIDHTAMSKVDAFLNESEKAIKASRQRLEDWLKTGATSKGKELLTLRQAIEKDLIDTSLDLEFLAGGNGAPGRR